MSITPIQPSLPAFEDKRKPNPNHDPKSEQPWHRALAYMLLQGNSNKECAKYFEKTPARIYQLKKTPWFKSLLAQLADIHFENDVAGLLQNAAFDAISTLSDLALGAESESVRRSAASDLLNQHLKTSIPVAKEAAADPKQELDNLNEEIERLETQN